jgi:hypothetical protein
VLTRGIVMTDLLEMGTDVMIDHLSTIDPIRGMIVGYTHVVGSHSQKMHPAYIIRLDDIEVLSESKLPVKDIVVDIPYVFQRPYVRPEL